MKYQMFTSLNCKEIRIRKLEFVAKDSVPFCLLSILVLPPRSAYKQSLIIN